MPTETIDAWSFNRLKIYEKCGYQAYQLYVKKVRPPQNTDPAAPNNRGTRIHKEAEDYVSGKIPFPASLKKLQAEFEHLHHRYAHGAVLLEQEWGFDRDWNETGWWDDNVWARIKPDAVELTTPATADVRDYKTGKSFGNEVTHMQQGLTYAIATFLRMPELEIVTTKLDYVDEGKTRPKHYTRKQAMMFLPKLTRRAETMTGPNADFSPRPNIHNCRFCPLKPSEMNLCEFGIDP